MTDLEVIKFLESLPLWPSEIKILRYLTNSKEDGEMVYAEPGGWWIGTEQVHGRTAFRLLRRSWLDKVWTSDEGRFEVYVLNEGGRTAAKNI